MARPRPSRFTRADRVQHLMADEVERLLAFEARNPLCRQVKVVHAYLAPDLGFLRVHYVLQQGGDLDERVQEALEHAAPWVARTLRETLQVRKAVEVAFKFDKDAMRLQRVDQLLADDRAGRVTVHAAPDGAVTVSGMAGGDEPKE
jgi:ribosome-binding factor A